MFATLIVWTANSTYVFDRHGFVQRVANSKKEDDGYIRWEAAYQHQMQDGAWYAVVRRPTEPKALDGAHSGIEFSIQAGSVRTSPVRNWTVDGPADHLSPWWSIDSDREAVVDMIQRWVDDETNSYCIVGDRLRLRFMIQAIKEVRAQLGLGLRESKDLLESVLNEASYEVASVNFTPTSDEALAELRRKLSS